MSTLYARAFHTITFGTEPIVSFFMSFDGIQRAHANVTPSSPSISPESTARPCPRFPRPLITTTSRLNHNLRPRIRDLDPQCLRLRQYIHPLPTADRARYLRRKRLIVHQQQVHVARVVHQEGFVARGHHVSGFAVGAVADLLWCISMLFCASSCGWRGKGGYWWNWGL